MQLSSPGKLADIPGSNPWVVCHSQTSHKETPAEEDNEVMIMKDGEVDVEEPEEEQLVIGMPHTILDPVAVVVVPGQSRPTPTNIDRVNFSPVVFPKKKELPSDASTKPPTVELESIGKKPNFSKKIKHGRERVCDIQIVN